MTQREGLETTMPERDWYMYARPFMEMIGDEEDVRMLMVDDFLKGGPSLSQDEHANIRAFIEGLAERRDLLEAVAEVARQNVRLDLTLEETKDSLDAMDVALANLDRKAK